MSRKRLSRRRTLKKGHKADAEGSLFDEQGQ